MNYTLRIINQNLDQAEMRRNYNLGESGYDVLIKTEDSQNPVKSSVFEKAINDYNIENPNTVMESNIIGFVYGQNVSFPIFEHEVAYIVGDKGQTIERIYGIYQKN